MTLAAFIAISTFTLAPASAAMISIGVMMPSRITVSVTTGMRSRLRAIIDWLITTLIGVNNRDLRSFQTDLEHTLRIRERVPDECVLVSESGIQTRADVLRLQAAGVDAVLVGESLMREPEIGRAVDQLLGRRC